MKRLWLFCGTAGLMLSSATPPAAGFQPRRLGVEPPSQPVEAPAPIQIAAAEVVPTVPPVVEAPQVVAPAPIQADTPWSTEPPAATQDSEPEKPKPSPPAWKERSKESGGVRVVVSIPQQKAYVFRGAELVATSPVSTGKRGHETPVGTFPILQKKVHHRSSKYDNAPMPYMQRLTHYGIALHAGSLPGYPASHGCIRLPRSFAKKLYGLTNYSTRVTVTKKRPKSAKDALKLA